MKLFLFLLLLPFSIYSQVEVNILEYDQEGWYEIDPSKFSDTVIYSVHDCNLFMDDGSVESKIVNLISEYIFWCDNNPIKVKCVRYLWSDLNTPVKDEEGNHVLIDTTCEMPREPSLQGLLKWIDDKGN